MPERIASTSISRSPKLEKHKDSMEVLLVRYGFMFLDCLLNGGRNWVLTRLSWKHRPPRGGIACLGHVTALDWLLSIFARGSPRGKLWRGLYERALNTALRNG